MRDNIFAQVYKINKVCEEKNFGGIGFFMIRDIEYEFTNKEYKIKEIIKNISNYLETISWVKGYMYMIRTKKVYTENIEINYIVFEENMTTIERDKKRDLYADEEIIEWYICDIMENGKFWDSKIRDIGGKKQDKNFIFHTLFRMIKKYTKAYEKTKELI